MQQELKTPQTNLTDDNKPILYHLPWHCSQRVVHLIYEAGIQDKVIIKTLADRSEIKTPEYLRLHPLGKVRQIIGIYYN